MMRFKRMPKQTFEFKDTTAPLETTRKARGRSEDDGTAGSLSYSAASSSMASTDSSFAEFRRVLEGDTSSKELASFLKEHVKKDEKSVAADSLAYSTDADTRRSFDAESHLQGSSLVSGGTATGRSSSNNSTQNHYASALGASYLNNGGGQRPDLINENFMTYEDETIKRRKERKRRDRVVPATSRPPPSPPRKQMIEEEDEDDVWYAKWWMFCFPSDVMNPKR